MSPAPLPLRNRTSSSLFGAGSNTLPNGTEIAEEITEIIYIVKHLDMDHARRSEFISTIEKVKTSARRANEDIESAVRLYDGDDDEKTQLRRLIICSDNLQHRTSQLLRTLTQLRVRAKTLQGGRISRFFDNLRSISPPDVDTVLKEMAAMSANALECFEGRDSGSLMEIIQEAKNVMEKQDQFRIAGRTSSFVVLEQN
ncbi:hypothetical protein PsYK624_104330 [Phanerochaete sordida]|uniref:Uncharacterized protein n=1 Tax=Phanerochaete sordida TaxID=48140 RepID=A0A9P3GIL4_9APHY|nr:hypothetical protein PsYK624_104330 [Phanerochaete sordida]